MNIVTACSFAAFVTGASAQNRDFTAVSTVAAHGGCLFSTATSDVGGFLVAGFSGEAIVGRAAFEPKTKLGKLLWQQRQKIVASGVGLRPAAELMQDLDASRS